MRNMKKNQNFRLLIELIGLLLFFGVLVVYVSLNQKFEFSHFDKQKVYDLKDYTACYNYTVKEDRIKCLVITLTSLSESSKSLSYCDLIEKNVAGNIGKEYANKCRDNLLFEKASNSLDASFCNYITNSILKGNCFDYVNQQLNDVINEKKECKLIRNEQKRNLCYDLVFKKLKVYGVNSEICVRFGELEKKMCEKALIVK